MEVGNEQVNTSQASVEGQGVQSEQPTRTESLEESVAKATHQRVLKESKQYKQQLQEKSERLKQLEEAQLSKDRQFEELAKRRSQENEELKVSISKLRLENDLKPALVAAGCVDADAAIALGNKDLLIETESGYAGREDFIEEIKKSKAYLFTAKTPSSVNASIPSGGLKIEVKTKDSSQMSSDEIMAELKRIEKQGG